MERCLESSARCQSLGVSPAQVCLDGALSADHGLVCGGFRSCHSSLWLCAAHWGQDAASSTLSGAAAKTHMDRDTGLLVRLVSVLIPLEKICIFVLSVTPA